MRKRLTPFLAAPSAWLFILRSCRLLARQVFLFSEEPIIWVFGNSLTPFYAKLNKVQVRLVKYQSSINWSSQSRQSRTAQMIFSYYVIYISEENKLSRSVNHDKLGKCPTIFYSLLSNGSFLLGGWSDTIVSNQFTFHR